MQINFTFKNFEPSDHLRKYASKRFDKLTKYIQGDGAVEIQVNMGLEKHRQVIEVVITGKDLHLSADEASDDMYASVDMITDKLEAQLRKMREKQKDRHKAAKEKSVRMDFISFGGASGGQRERTITATDHYEPKPMSIDEAAEQLDNLKYEFLVFRNAETDRVNVIYRRKGDDFGLIDPGN